MIRDIGAPVFNDRDIAEKFRHQRPLLKCIRETHFGGSAGSNEGIGNDTGLVSGDEDSISSVSLKRSRSLRVIYSPSVSRCSYSHLLSSIVAADLPVSHEPPRSRITYPGFIVVLLAPLMA